MDLLNQNVILGVELMYNVQLIPVSFFFHSFFENKKMLKFLFLAASYCSVDAISRASCTFREYSSLPPWAQYVPNEPVKLLFVFFFFKKKKIKF